MLDLVLIIELSNVHGVRPHERSETGLHASSSRVEFIRGFLLRELASMRNVKRHHMTGNLTRPSAPATSAETNQIGLEA